MARDTILMIQRGEQTIKKNLTLRMIPRKKNASLKSFKSFEPLNSFGFELFIIKNLGIDIF